MSFVTQDGIMRLIEDIMSEVITGSLPHVAPPSRPFPAMSYRQAIDEVKYTLALCSYTLTHYSHTYCPCIHISTAVIFL